MPGIVADPGMERPDPITGPAVGVRRRDRIT